MLDFLIKLYNSDKQAFALLLQAFVASIVGILAWIATCGQINLAQKKERRDLFKLRYENLYQEVNKMHDEIFEIITKVHFVNAEICESVSLPKKEVIKKLEAQFFITKQNFFKGINANKYLIKVRDFDILYSTCSDLFGRGMLVIKSFDSNELDVFYREFKEYFDVHYDDIKNIIEKYLYHENENKISLLVYKVSTYLKVNYKRFVISYFPTYNKLCISLNVYLHNFITCLLNANKCVKNLLKKDVLSLNKKMQLPPFLLKKLHTKRPKHPHL